MMRLAPRYLALVLVLGSHSVACSRVTTVSPASPIEVTARPPAPPLAELPAVPQPPPPRRVILEGELLTLDEALTFDAEGKLASEHHDILAELAKWLGENADVVELIVEVHSIGEGSKRAHTQRSNALAQQIVDALVEQGVGSDRLVAASVGRSPDGQRDVALRIRRAEAGVGFEVEE
jgi:outer membrane protein OmpA-like peptidoglycan-associated protein